MTRKFDLHEWLNEQKELSGGEKDLAYWAKRWKCSQQLISRIRSGEKRISLDLAPMMFADIPVSMEEYYSEVFPRMHAAYLARCKALSERDFEGRFDPCRRCGTHFEEHTNYDYATYLAGVNADVQCSGYERWVRRGKGRPGEAA